MTEIKNLMSMHENWNFNEFTDFPRCQIPRLNFLNFLSSPALLCHKRNRVIASRVQSHKSNKKYKNQRKRTCF